MVQNAIKYTKHGGTIWLRASTISERVQIEVEDQCGEIEVEKNSSLFHPYVQKNADRSGLGLGLAITQRAIRVSNKSAVQGKDSVQPAFGRPKHYQ